MYRYVFETPFGRLTSEGREGLDAPDIRAVAAHPDLGRYLHEIQQLRDGVWVTV